VKLVLDTNIFVSSFFYGGNPRKVLERSIEGVDDLYCSLEILKELSLVMQRPKFNVPTLQISFFIKEIEDISRHVTVSGSVKDQCRDKDDNKILECALEGKVLYIVTGDNDLLVLNEFEGIKIMTASQYLQEMGIEIQTLSQTKPL